MAIGRRPDRRMMGAGIRATNVAPRFNNNAGSQAGPQSPGRRSQTSPQTPGRRPENPGRRRFEPGGMPEIGEFQPDQQWGAGNAYNAGDTMTRIARNEYLNTLAVGGPREQAMNAMGYWTGGTPFTPSQSRSDAKFYRQNARNNAETGDFSAPGIYQHQDTAGNYVGFTTVNPDGTAKYQSLGLGFTPGRPGPGGGGGGGGRPSPRGNQSPGGMPGQGPGGGGGGGGNRPGPRRNQRPRGGGGGRGGYNGQGTPGAMGQYANFPAPQEPAQDFLPMTPQFEAGRRGLTDEQMGAQTDILAQQAMVNPLYQQQLSRMQTQQDFDTQRMKEELAGRGVYTPYGASGSGWGAQPMAAKNNAGGGVGQYLFNRDIEIPYGRGYSDLATSAAQQYGDLSTQYGGSELAYNQGLAELLLNRASDASQNISMGVPQWSTGGRVLRGQRYNNRPNKPGRNRGRRNRGKK